MKKNGRQGFTRLRSSPHSELRRGRCPVCEPRVKRGVSRTGFTLIELLVTMTIIGVLSGSVILAIGPTKQLTNVRDAERFSASKELSNAMYQRLIDKWELPSAAQIPECTSDDLACAKPICKESVSDEDCHTNGGVSLAVIPPEYLAALPVDLLMSDQDRCTGYMVYKQTGRPKVFAANVGKLLGDTPETECGCGKIGGGVYAGSGDQEEEEGPAYGNGIIDVSLGEVCDDDNTEIGDGCDATGQVEDGWSCDTAEPSVCTEDAPSYGNGIIEEGEECDDGNTATEDGCDATGQVEDGWSCDTAEPSVCTEEAFACGATLTDSRDGKTYPTILIGSQCWMAKNIDVGTRIVGSTNQGTSCSSIEKYCYSDNDANCTTYGGLYQWGQAMCGSEENSNVQGICPIGWHIPTHDEFTTLERAVCTSATCETDFPYDTTTTGFRGTNEGTKLKTGGTSGFAALFGGRSDAGTYSNVGFTANFWSLPRSGPFQPYAWTRSFISVFSRISRDSAYIRNGNSVRCLMDEGPIAPQCSDGIDNADAEDTLIDCADPGCHTDGNAANPESCDPDDESEVHTPSPGNGVIEAGEECDDGNATNADGCDVAGQMEDGWECSGEPSVCWVRELGDVNNDGAVTEEDAALVADHLSGESLLNADDMYYADVDQFTFYSLPGIIVTKADYYLILGKVAGKITLPAVYGDMTGNGSVSGYDSSLAQSMSMGLLEPTEQQRYLADLNYDGRITRIDHRMISLIVVWAPIIPPMQLGDADADEDIDADDVTLATSLIGSTGLSTIAQILSDANEDDSITQADVTLIELAKDGAIANLPAVFGDADNDRDIDAADVTAVTQHAAGSQLLTGEALIRCDVNLDDVVNATDAALIQNAINLEIELPVSP